MKRNLVKQAGFTLVELAIVLVIIGLIIGGVLVGQDLIKAAAIRSSVTDIEKFNAGATAFRGKYNGLPGDITAGRAVEFGLSATADANAAGTAGLRDGNSVIEGAAAGSSSLRGEIALFWQDLGATGLIAGTYTGIGTAVGPAAAVTAANVRDYLPTSKLRDNASYYVYATGGRNMFYIGSIAAAQTTGAVTTGNSVSPIEARGIDEKVDDGFPTTGTVLSHTDLATLDAGTTVTTSTCMDGTASPKVYNGLDANSSGINCQLQIRSSF